LKEIIMSVSRRTYACSRGITAILAVITTTVFAGATPANRNGGLLLRDGSFRPLPDFPDAAATMHVRVNNRGDIVGNYGLTAGDANNPARLSGFIMRDDVFTSIDVPGSITTIALGLNDRGQVVGGYLKPGATVNPATGESGPVHGYMWDEGTFTLFDVPGATTTAPYDINDRGRIVGNYGDAASVQHGFILEDGIFTSVDHPSATHMPNLTATRLVGLDDHGRIVGSYGDDAGIIHAIVREKDGAFTTIGPPDVVASEASAVNKRGQIVGRYLDGTGKLVSFLQDRRQLITIDVPDRCDTAAFDITDRGQILIAPTGTTDGTTCPASDGRQTGR
jgi:uncharacterized membrane protein